MAAVLLIFAVCLLSLSSADGQGVIGLPFLATDGTIKLTLTCPEATSSEVVHYVWFTPGLNINDTRRCQKGSQDRVCIFTPRIKDDQQNVTCLATTTAGTEATALYTVNLKYPPQSSPTINPESSQKKTLTQGDIIKCTVSGGKPRVTSVTFHCQHPDLADGEDDVSDDGRNVSSSVRVHLSNTTGVYMNCTCSATWQPEPDLYSEKTAMRFLLETSPRIMDSSYDRSNPPILEATGHTFFLVADPTPDNITSYFLGTKKEKEPVPNNTFKTKFTKNSSMTHLVNCRVTPQNVPAEKLGLYELSLSNGLGDVSLRVNVTTPVIQRREKDTTGTSMGEIIGIIVGVAVVIVLVVIIVTIVIRRKNNAGQKGHNASFNDNQAIETTASTTLAMPTTTSPDPQSDFNATDTNCKPKYGPSSTFIVPEPGYATPGEVGKTDCRSSDSNGGTIDNSEQDDYNHLNENNASPVDSSTYSRVGDDSRGAQQEGSVDSATPTSIASHPDQPTDKNTGPEGEVYATVVKKKGGNPSTTDEVHT